MFVQPRPPGGIPTDKKRSAFEYSINIKKRTDWRVFPNGVARKEAVALINLSGRQAELDRNANASFIISSSVGCDA